MHKFIHSFNYFYGTLQALSKRKSLVPCWGALRSIWATD